MPDHSILPPSTTPKHIHFIYVAQEPKDLPFIYYIAIKSAKLHNPDYKITLHCNAQPTGHFWRILGDVATVSVIDVPETVFGRPIARIEHRADVLRLEILLECGGVYLDLDTVCLKPLDNFLRPKLVMGHESNGLCNAVIFAPKNSMFLLNWYDGYRNFHNEQWNEFSVQLPLKLAMSQPDLIDVEPRTTFFVPDCDAASLRDLFQLAKEFPQAYIYHLWNAAAKDYIAGINPRSIYTQDTTYNLVARDVVGMDRDALTNDEEPKFADEMAKLEAAFLNIYETSEWGKGSGNGSHPESTLVYRSFVENFIVMNGIRSIIDIGCGDWQSSRYICYHGARYTGFDVVSALVAENNKLYGTDVVHFATMPESPLDLPAADLIIMKDVLQHLSDEHIFFYRDQIFPKYRFCLITNSYRAINYQQNTNITPGAFRSLDVLADPYRFKGGYVVETWNQWERMRTMLVSNS